jgi:hypothetical protein
VIKKCRYCGKEFNASGREVTCGSETCRRKLKYDDSVRKLNYNRKYNLIHYNAGRPTYERKCKVCGSDFETHRRNQVKCPHCIKIDKISREKRKADSFEPLPTELAKIELECEKRLPAPPLDDVLKECRRMGISYSEWQRKQTAAMYARVEV